MESNDDLPGSASTVQQPVAWAWVGAYAGMMSVLWCEQYFSFYLTKSSWEDAAIMAVAWAFLILFVSRVAKKDPLWQRIPFLFSLSVGIFVWMFCSLFALLFEFMLLDAMANKT